MNEAAHAPVRLFVVGVGRSGTSLLQAMLGSHPEIDFLPETGFLRRWCLTDRSSDTALDADGRAALARAWREDDRLARADGSAQAIADVLETATADDRRSARQLSLALYERLSAGRPHRFAGDKDPRLIEHVEDLAALWPGCRVVHIHRDPRDVLASKKLARWSAGQRVWRQLLASAAQFRLIGGAERRLPASSVHSLAYEALLAEPETTLRALCRWLDIAYAPALLDFAPTARRLVAPDELEWKSRTLGPLLSGNSGQWAERLSAFEIATVESACRQAMVRGGHSRATDGAFVPRAVGTLVGLPIRAAAAAYAAARRRSSARSRAAGEAR